MPTVVSENAHGITGGPGRWEGDGPGPGTRVLAEVVGARSPGCRCEVFPRGPYSVLHLLLLPGANALRKSRLRLCAAPPFRYLRLSEARREGVRRKVRWNRSSDGICYRTDRVGTCEPSCQESFRVGLGPVPPSYLLRGGSAGEDV